MNARQELKRELEGTARIKCALIYQEADYDEDYNPICEYYKLPLNYTDSDLENFYKSLNFEYDSGFGGQRLFGTVWLEDSTWLSRGEYDGSEWWKHNVLPEIPTELL